MNLTEKQLDEIYDIAITYCGAHGSFRADFIRYALEKSNASTKEFRFCGLLGFGGKIWIDRTRCWISCYSEDRTPEREELINRANERIKELFNG